MNPDWWPFGKRNPTSDSYTFTSNTAYSSMTSDQMYQAILKSVASLNATAGSVPDIKFSGKEFAASSAKGARSFRVDETGRLTGIHYKQVWTPGENIAACKMDAPHPEGKFPDCRCGFYGYYDGSNDYYRDGYVSAVVQGWGEAVMGENGFRVTKAKILALTINENVIGKVAHLVRRNYDGIPMFESFGEMVRTFQPDYGLNDAELPKPTDDDFWTRDA